MGVVEFPVAEVDGGARALVRSLTGGRGPVDALAAEAEARRRAMRTRRTLADAALDVVTVWWLASGDPGRTEGLVRIWTPKVVRWTRATCGRHDPDDLVQEVLVRFVGAMGGLRDGFAVGGWLWQTTFRVVREAERRSRWRWWTDGVGALLGLRDERRGAAESHLVDEQLRLVQAILDQLPHEQRALLWAAYVEDLDRATLGERFGLAEGTLGRRLTAARKAFEEACRRRGVTGVLP